MIGELLKIANQCDGVRCDMAMLVLPKVFERTWGRQSAPVLAGCDAARARAGARFLENHDEPRAATAFAPSSHEAAAIITYLTPGLRFFHQGQFEGRKKRISPHLVRAPVEESDAALKRFYQDLLAVLRLPIVREGTWRLLECAPAWGGNWTSDCFVISSWHLEERRLLIAVNYAANQSQCFVRLQLSELSGRAVRFNDLMSPAVFDRDSGDLQQRGLYLDMPARSYHVFEVTTH
jgi:hypothetical protein